MKSFEKLSAGETDEGKLFIFEEMKLWLESIAPTDTSNQDSMD